MVLCATLKKTNSVFYKMITDTNLCEVCIRYFYFSMKENLKKSLTIRLKNERAWAMENVLYSHQFASNPSVHYKEPGHGIHHLQNNLLGKDEV